MKLDQINIDYFIYIIIYELMIAIYKGMLELPALSWMESVSI